MQYRIGQMVRVTYDARVAEVGAEHAHRDGRIIRLETNAIPTGWVDPTQEGLSIEVISEPMPTEPGMYWQADNSESQSRMDKWHSDGKAFHYLNAGGEWADVGWGVPDPDLPLNPLIDRPF